MVAGVLLFLALAGCGLLTSRGPVPTAEPVAGAAWVRQFGSPGSEWAFVVVDGAGNIIVAGATDATLPGQTSAGDRDAFVLRLDQPFAP